MELCSVVCSVIRTFLNHAQVQALTRGLCSTQSACSASHLVVFWNLMVVLYHRNAQRMSSLSAAEPQQQGSYWRKLPGLAACSSWKDRYNCNKISERNLTAPADAFMRITLLACVCFFVAHSPTLDQATDVCCKSHLRSGQWLPNIQMYPWACC